VADFDHVFGTNVKGAFFVAQEGGAAHDRPCEGWPGVSRPYREHCLGRRLARAAQIGLYCMSKAAVIQMTRAQALEWGRYGINVNAICPGYIRTEINDEYWDTDGGRKLVQMLPRRRVRRSGGSRRHAAAAGRGRIAVHQWCRHHADDGLSVS